MLCKLKAVRDVCFGSSRHSRCRCLKLHACTVSRPAVSVARRDCDISVIGEVNSYQRDSRAFPSVIFAVA
jgi:hypothetical protein